MKTNNDPSGLRQDELLRYLRGTMTDEEQYALERRMMADEQLEEAMTGLMDSGISEKEIEADAVDLRRRWMNRKTDSTTLGITGYQLRWAGAAAAILLLFFIVRGYWLDQHNNQLFAEYFSTETLSEDPIRIRGEGIAGGAIGQAYQWYEEQAYAKSLAAFQLIAEQDPEHTAARFYAGLSAMQLGQYFEAEVFLQQLTERDSVETIAARWYLALLYVQMGQEADALDQLDWLTTFADGPYLEKARALIQELAPVE